MERNFTDRLKVGLSHHLQGRLTEASKIYATLLDESPDHPEVLQLAGALVLDRGDAKEACDLLEKAVKLNPDFTPVKINYAIALAACDRTDEALTLLRDVITLAPHAPEGYLNAGRVMLAKGDFTEARNMLKKAVTMLPSDAVAQNDYAIALQKLGHIEEALEANQVACSLEPQNAIFRANRCSLRLDCDDFVAAVEDGEKAISIERSCKEAHYNLANAYQALDQFCKARLCYRRAIEIDPFYSDAYANLAAAELALENVGFAIKFADKALMLDSTMAEAAWTRSLALLLSGDYRSGWEEYESRWAAVSFLKKRVFDVPEWDGGPVSGKTLLIYSEQGLGDGLQFVRYGALLAELGANVVLECPSPLVPLFAKLPWLRTVVPLGKILPPFDFHVALMSLPHKFGTTLETVPAVVPYLPVPKSRLKHDKLTIGIAWRGSKTNLKGLHRSCSVSDLEPLFLQKSVKFVSLQTELNKEDQKILARFDIEDLGCGVRDFLDTAEVVSGIDLIITVDTALAHLAGGMGKPVWVMIPHGPDWRWLLEREDSPWYPTARLFRQSKRNNWVSVVERVRKALANHLQNNF